jgi:hypothetical protein
VRRQSDDAITLYRFVMRIPRWWLLLMIVPAVADEGIFDQYRDLMGDDNPAIFVIDEGAEFWVQSQGPSAATLEACDLGLGAGVTRGAYAQLPRYFADTDRVMDIETRLLYCMETLAGPGSRGDCSKALLAERRFWHRARSTGDLARGRVRGDDHLT